MEQFGFYFNAKRCTGCKTCMLACKDYRNLDASVSFRQVYEFVGGSWSKDERGCWAQDCFAFYGSSACNHCASPACMEVCPTGAMGNATDALNVREKGALPSAWKLVRCGRLSSGLSPICGRVTVVSPTCPRFPIHRKPHLIWC